MITRIAVALAALRLLIPTVATWACDRCGAVNSDGVVTCYRCGS